MTTRHSHPVLILTVIACFGVILASQGLVVRKASNAAVEAKHAAESADETANIARDVTDPNCDQRRPACRRQVAQREGGGQATVVADIEEVSVVGAYCAQQHQALADIRTCVAQEFARTRGRAPAGGGPPPGTTSTTRPGG